jgi:hypothetical protein
MKEIKNRIAVEKGYPSWDEMYDWISRPGQKPEVVAQLIESATIEYAKELIIDAVDLLDHNYSPTSNDRIASAYHEGLISLRDEVISNI